MIARNAEGATGVHHVVDQLVCVHDAWSTVDEVAEENGLSALGMAIDPRIGRRDLDGPFSPGVAQLRQQLLQFIATAMHVADDVKGTMVLLTMAPQRLALDG